MWFFSWLRSQTSTRSRLRDAFQSRPPGRLRPRLEALEDRCLPSTFYAATASDLIADIKAANLQGGANTIVLTAPTTSPYAMSAVDNNTNGYNMLPVIANGDNLTILTNNGSASPGFGDTIWSSQPVSLRVMHGRLFDVANGGSLTLENVTLAGGRQNQGGSVMGGAIYNQGTVVLDHALVNGNAAISSSLDAEGGGIWSNGSLTVENSSAFLGNSASSCVTGNYGYLGSAFGGAIYIAGGTANIMGSTFGDQNLGWDNNTANGPKAYGGAVYVGGGTVTMSGDTVGYPDLYSIGKASNGAMFQPSSGPVTGPWSAFGGGLCLAGGTVTLTNDTIINNEIRGNGLGGGIFIGNAQVYLDSFTLAHTQYNYGPYGFGPKGEIDGLYTVLAQSSLIANSNPITAGSSLTLTATNLAPATPGATIAQVSFFYFDSNGAKHVLGNGIQTSTGVWTLIVKANLKPGTYTLWAQAQDSDGLFGSAASLTLTVQ
jgi:hypothetical protein